MSGKAHLMGFRIWHKLLISSLVYMLPIAVLLYFVESWIHNDIRFAETEIQGIQVITPLEELGSLLPYHQLLAHLYLDGDKTMRDPLKVDSTNITLAFDLLETAAKIQGKVLRIDPESMKQAELEDAEPSALRKQWNDLHTGLEKLTTRQSDIGHRALDKGVQTLMTRLGRRPT